MAVPQTNGVLRTTLASMNIGDYILFQYDERVSPGSLGIFKSGVLNNYDSAITNELALSPYNLGQMISGDYIHGIFYFIKADNGLLISDRMVISSVSAQALNIKNYLLGAKVSDNAMIRCLSRAEFLNYIANSDLNGNIIKQDVSVWHGPTSHSDLTQGSGANFELNQNRTGSSIALSYFMDGSAPITNSGGGTRTAVPLSTGYTVASQYTIVACGFTLSVAFRPVLEYVDNSKSTNLYY